MVITNHQREDDKDSYRLDVAHSVGHCWHHGSLKM